MRRGLGRSGLKEEVVDMVSTFGEVSVYLMKETEGRRFLRVMQDDPCKCAGLPRVWATHGG